MIDTSLILHPIHPPSLPALPQPIHSMPTPTSLPNPISPVSIPLSNQPTEIQQFSPEMHEWLQELIHKYPFSAHLCLLDLFGMEMQKQLDKIADIHQSENKFMMRLLCFYITLLRTSTIFVPFTGNEKIHSEGKHKFQTKNDFIIDLDHFIMECTAQLRLKTTNKVSQKIKELREKNFQESMHIFKFLKELLKRPDAHVILLHTTIGNWTRENIFTCHYQISSHHIQTYCAYITALFSCHYHKKPPFITAIQTMKSTDYQTANGLSAFYKKVEKIRNDERSDQELLAGFIMSIDKGRITIKDVRLFDCSTMNELKELKLFEYFGNTLTALFANDMLMLAEQLGAQQIPGYIPRTTLVKKITNDLYHFSDTATPTPSDIDPFRQLIQRALKNYFSSLEESFTHIRNIHADWRGSSLSDLTTAFKETIDQFEILLQNAQFNELHAIPAQILELAMTLPPEERKEKVLLEQIGFEELKIYLPLLKIVENLRLLRDFNATSQDLFQIFGQYIHALESLPIVEESTIAEEKPFPLFSENSIKPPSIVSVEELPSSSKMPDPEISTSENSIKSLSIVSVEEFSSSPKMPDPETSIVKEKTPITLPAKLHQKKHKQRSHIDKHNKTWQEIWRELIEQGFLPIRQKGSHAIFSFDGKSAHVILPIHDKTLKLGTVSGIYKQRDTAVEKTKDIAVTALARGKK